MSFVSVEEAKKVTLAWSIIAWLIGSLGGGYAGYLGGKVRGNAAKIKALEEQQHSELESMTQQLRLCEARLRDK